MDPTSNPFELLSDEGHKKLVKTQQPAAAKTATAVTKAAPVGKATTASSGLAPKPKGTPEAPVKQGPKNPIANPTFGGGDDSAPRTQRGGRGGRGSRGGRGDRGGRGSSRAVQTGRKREFDHHVSGTGRPMGDEKKAGRGRGNWGGQTEEGVDVQAVADDVTHNTEHKEGETAAEENVEHTSAPVVEEEPDNSVSYAQFEQEQQEKAEALKKLLGGNREVRKPEASIPKQFTKIEADEDDESDDESDKKSKKTAQKKTPSNQVSAEQLGFTSPPIDRDRRGGRGGRGGRGTRGGRGGRGGNTRGDNKGDAPARGGRGGRGGNFDASGSSQKYNDLFPSLSGK